MIRVLYFAALRERIGLGEQSLTLPAGIDRVDRLMDWLAAQDEAHTAAFAHRAGLRCAVNQTLAEPTTSVAPGDEIAFFPPMTGG